jgi:hypothetical protein
LANALGRGVDGPDFTGGVFGLGVARAVKAHKAHDLFAVDRDHHLGFTVFDGFFPIGHALGHGGDGPVLVGHLTGIGHAASVQVQSGHSSGVLLGGKSDLDIGHVLAIRGETNRLAPRGRPSGKPDIVAASVIFST